MKRSRNASPGPSKRTRQDEDQVETPEIPLPPRPSFLPARPPRPTVGLAMISARANQVLRELEEGDQWCHVDNRSRQELHGWTWEERLDATGALVRTPIAFSGTTVTVGNIRLSWYDGDEELLKRSLYQIFAVHGRIEAIFLYPAVKEEQKFRLLKLTFASYSQTVAARRQDGKISMTAEDTPLFVRRQTHRPGVSWFVAPRSQLAELQQQTSRSPEREQARFYRESLDLNIVPPSQSEAVYPTLPATPFSDLGYNLYPPELPPISHLSYVAEVGLRENQRSVARELAKMYTTDLAEWDDIERDHRVRAMIAESLVRPEMTDTFEGRSYSNNMFAWGDLYDAHPYYWAKNEFRKTISDTQTIDFTGLETMLDLEPKQATSDYLREFCGDSWTGSDAKELKGLMRCAAALSIPMIKSTGIDKMIKDRGLQTTVNPDQLIRTGFEKARNFAQCKQFHPGESDPLFPVQHFWTPNTPNDPIEWETLPDLVLDHPLGTPAPPYLKPPSRPPSPSNAPEPEPIEMTPAQSEVAKFRAQHGHRKR